MRKKNPNFNNDRSRDSEGNDRSERPANRKPRKSGDRPARKSHSGGGRPEGGNRKPFGRKPEGSRSFGEGKERRPVERRSGERSEGEGERRDFKRSDDKRSYNRSGSEGGRERRDFKKPGEKRPFGRSSGSDSRFRSGNESRGERGGEERRSSFRDRNERSGERGNSGFKGESKRSFDKSDRPKRSFDRDDRPKRDFKQNDRPKRSFDREDRPKRDFQRDDRPKRSFDRDDRPKKSFGNREKPAYANFRNKRKAAIAEKPDDGLIRLNKYVANAGICSRRQADEYIKTGVVEVNGTVITEMGFKVKPEDDVRFDGQRISPEKKVYVLLNKPKGFITTTSDERDRKTVMDLVAGASKSRLFPVGRLDRQTTGVLLFTNDGHLAKKLTHPSHNIKKIYHVVLDRNLHGDDMGKIRDGIRMEEGIAKVDKISFIEGKAHNEVGVEIHIGWNRVVRRIFEKLGYKIENLDRVQFAGLTKKNVKRGDWRTLDDKEVNFLHML